MQDLEAIPLESKSRWSALLGGHLKAKTLPSSRREFVDTAPKHPVDTKGLCE